MCGIAGLVPFAPGAGADPSWLERLEIAADRLGQRGPDARWVGRQGGALLAATRLAIVDRTPASNPPIVDPTGQVSLLYNGELFDAAGLRAELAARGFRFRSNGDGEIVLAAYLEYGARFLREIDGMFALALLDRRRESEEGSPRLILARDRFGEKPLLFARTGELIAFASTMAAMIAILPSPQEDADGVAATIRHGFGPRGESAVKSVFRIRPGTALLIAKGGASVYPFAERKVANLDGATLPELADHCRKLLRQAVARRARSEAGVGLFLSGGIDSAALAFALADEGIAARTYTVGFRGESDERNGARATAEAAGLPWVLHEHGAEILDHWWELTTSLGEPIPDASALNLLSLARRAKQDVSVILSGEGGDELFGGYRRERAFQAMGALRVPRRVAAALETLPGEAGRMGSALGRSPGPGRYQELRDRVREAEELLIPAFRRGDAGSEEGVPRDPNESADAAVVARDSDLHSYLPNDLLFRLDGAAMTASLEPRAPFLDPDLADFGCSLPAKFRTDWRAGKKILRASLAGRAPASVLRGRKRGFGPPIARWFRESGFLEGILFASGACEPPLQRKAVEAMWLRHRRGKADHSVVLARAAAVELFRRALPLLRTS